MAADIVEIKHIMLPPSPREFKDIYVVFELMETDLHQACTPRALLHLLLHNSGLRARLDCDVRKYRRTDLL